MNYLDLFSGIGGFALGAYWAGMKFENHYASEIDKYCIELYQKRFPDSIQLGDITKIETDKLPKGDWTITGGIPCQPFSVAGKREGRNDDRYLWPPMFSIISDLEPALIIFENVTGIIGMELDNILSDLESKAYTNTIGEKPEIIPLIIPACAIGANHRRDRVWIVAYPINSSNRTNWRSGRKKETISGEHRSSGRAGMFNRTGDEISDTSIKRLERQKPEGEFRGREPGLSAQCGWWSTEPDVGRLAHGVPHRVDRLKGLGNAIVPQIAELLFRQVNNAINNR